MFAYYRYAGEPVTVIEDANALILEVDGEILCRLKKAPVKKLSLATSEKRSNQVKSQAKRRQLPIPKREKAKVLNLADLRKNR